MTSPHPKLDPKSRKQIDGVFVDIREDVKQANKDESLCDSSPTKGFKANDGSAMPSCVTTSCSSCDDSKSNESSASRSFRSDGEDSNISDIDNGTSQRDNDGEGGDYCSDDSSSSEEYFTDKVEDFEDNR